MQQIANPYRPGAGQAPLYLAGRTRESDRFTKILSQNPVLRNVILSGLRGVGKTTLLETFKPIAQREGWIWTGTDLSESASLTEERMAKRLIADLSALLGPILQKTVEQPSFGFLREPVETKSGIDYYDIWNLYEQAPGLAADKLKRVISDIRNSLSHTGIKGIVFAYDEAQILTDHAKDREFPLSTLLDVFSSLQRQHHDIGIILVLTGLPTLFPKLNEARTYSERMFDLIMLEKLSDESSRDAIEKPLEIANSSIRFSQNVVNEIVNLSGGYPYFIQYICKEIFDVWIGQLQSSEVPTIARKEIVAKLDQDFFSPRWDRATDRQRQFMYAISVLENGDGEFSTQEVVKSSRDVLEKGFSPSHATQILNALVEKGLVYRNRHGKYSFAVPLMADFIRRQEGSF